MQPQRHTCLSCTSSRRPFSLRQGPINAPTTQLSCYSAWCLANAWRPIFYANRWNPSFFRHPCSLSLSLRKPYYGPWARHRRAVRCRCTCTRVVPSRVAALAALRIGLGRFTPLTRSTRATLFATGSHSTRPSLFRIDQSSIALYESAPDRESSSPSNMSRSRHASTCSMSTPPSE